jgi:hypothetical protein
MPAKPEEDEDSEYEYEDEEDEREQFFKNYISVKHYKKDPNILSLRTE